MGAEVKVLTVQQVMSELGYSNKSLKYEEEFKLLTAWCEKNKASYYAKPKDTFFISEAKAQAMEEENSIVVIEDLS